MTSGGTPTTTVSEYWNGGISWISPKDFSSDIELSASTLNISEAGRAAARLDLLPAGTVALVVRSGVLSHTLPVAVLSKPATINQDIKALTLIEDIDPKYLAYYLATHQNYLLPLIRKHGATVHSVNTPELEELEIPLPPLDVQRQLVDKLDSTQIQRDRALAESEQLLTSFESWATQKIGIAAIKSENRKVYAIPRLNTATRIDPFYHAPEFIELERAIRSVPHQPLGSLVMFSNATWNPREHTKATFRYIEINGVDRRRGHIKTTEIAVVDAPSRARMIVQPGDIIVSLTRPHHGSIALLNDEHKGCIASTGFAIIRAVDTTIIQRSFLWAVLRLTISLKQMLRRSSGGNYPAITQDELRNILIPVPNKDIQQMIAKEVMRRSSEADRLESLAQTSWAEASAWFQQQLLQKDAT